MGRSPVCDCPCFLSLLVFSIEQGTLSVKINVKIKLDRCLVTCKIRCYNVDKLKQKQAECANIR